MGEWAHAVIVCCQFLAACIVAVLVAIGIHTVAGWLP